LPSKPKPKTAVYSRARLVAIQVKIVTKDPSITRVLYAVQEKTPKQPYVLTIRAVQTRDFLTARVAEIPWATLRETAKKILSTCSNISSVHYNITPKPPATIEMNNIFSSKNYKAFNND